MATRTNLSRRTHGKRGKRLLKEYDIWVEMRARCRNPRHRSYRHYGGRGITICPAWLESFEAFYRDMGPKPEETSLERVDNDGPYSPDNCRWIPKQQQSRNRRNCLKVTYRGQQVKLVDLAEEAPVSLRTLRFRIFRYGMSVEEAMSAPKYSQWRNRRRRADGTFDGGAPAAASHSPKASPTPT